MVRVIVSGGVQLDLSGRVVRESRVRVLNYGFMRVLDPSKKPARNVAVKVFKAIRDRVKPEGVIKRE